MFIFAHKLTNIMRKHKLVHYITRGCDSYPAPPDKYLKIL